MLDEIWIALDTYSDELGESLLPTGDSIPFRSEFALHITNYSAKLHVIEAYDIFGIWHNVSTSEQLFRSTPTDGAPWDIVRWKNNSGQSDVQYIGNLQVNHSFQAPSSMDGVTIHQDKIKIKIPWSLINFVAPDQMIVLHDDRNTPQREDTISDGIHISVFYKNNWYATNNRITWPLWNSNEFNNHEELSVLKTSYFVMRNHLINDFNTPAIAYRDSFFFEDETYPLSVSASEGVLKNDFDLDGDKKIALIVNPLENGHITLHNDGSFTYYPNNGFNGIDSLTYCVYDGHSLSEPNVVVFSVLGNDSLLDELTIDELLSVYPNPTSSIIHIRPYVLFEEITLFDSGGKSVVTLEHGQSMYELDLSPLRPGMYLIVGRLDNTYYSKRIIKN